MQAHLDWSAEPKYVVRPVANPEFRPSQVFFQFDDREGVVTHPRRSYDRGVQGPGRIRAESNRKITANSVGKNRSPPWEAMCREGPGALAS